MQADNPQYLNRRLKPGDTFGQGGLETRIPPRPSPNSAALAIRLLGLFIVVLLLTVILLVIAGQRGRQDAQGWTWDDRAALTAVVS